MSLDVAEVCSTSSTNYRRFRLCVRGTRFSVEAGNRQARSDFGDRRHPSEVQCEVKVLIREPGMRIDSCYQRNTGYQQNARVTHQSITTTI